MLRTRYLITYEVKNSCSGWLLFPIVCALIGITIFVIICWCSGQEGCIYPRAELASHAHHLLQQYWAAGETSGELHWSCAAGRGGGGSSNQGRGPKEGGVNGGDTIDLSCGKLFYDNQCFGLHPLVGWNCVILASQTQPTISHMGVILTAFCTGVGWVWPTTSWKC